ncbi:MAG: MFS transporter, partial [Euryarchaeota archaeon]|nr:MFS transporter [Euryarchaeota archaeon]
VIKFKAPYRALLLSLVIYAVYFALMAILQVSFLILAAFFILGLGNGVASPNTISVFQMNADKEHLRQVLGVVGTLIDAARILSVITMGVLVDVVPLKYIYVFLAVGIMITFVLFGGDMVRNRLKPSKKLNNGSKRYP